METRGWAVTTVYIRPRGSAWWHRLEAGTIKITSGAWIVPEPPPADDDYPPIFESRARATLHGRTRCGLVYNGAGFAVSPLRPIRGRFCGRCG